MPEMTTDTYTPPTTWAEMWDSPENLGPDLFQDQPQEPGKRSTAVRMAARRRHQEQAAQQDRDLRQIDAIAQEQAEDDALVDVLHRRRLRSKIPTGTMALAHRALARRGSDVTSADQMADAYFGRR